jgi:hypothetical protein
MRFLGQHRFAPVSVWEEALEVVHLGQIIEDDIGVTRVFGHEILVVELGRIEACPVLEAGDDGIRIRVCRVKLRDIGLCCLELGGAGRENG